LGKHAFLYLEQKGLKGLAFGANGFRQLTNSLLPVRTPENLTGVRCRVAGSRIFFRTFELLGADALTMNFGEVFTSLQQGVIDAQENPLSIIYSSRLYEVQPYLTIWNYSYDRDLPGLLSDQGMQIIRLSEEEIKQFKKMVLPVYEEFTPLIGKELVTLCIDEVKRTD
jgi:TRAP-type C4-dicarboxylate transport system substrate-binding protein